jgi:hypothetical protein
LGSPRAADQWQVNADVLGGLAEFERELIRWEKEYAMSKEQKTARELEAMIEVELNDPRVTVVVRPDPKIRWMASASAWEGTDKEPIERIDQIAERLRAKYDLKEDRACHACGGFL